MSDSDTEVPRKPGPGFPSGRALPEAFGGRWSTNSPRHQGGYVAHGMFTAVLSKHSCRNIFVAQPNTVPSASNSSGSTNSALGSVDPGLTSSSSNPASY